MVTPGFAGADWKPDLLPSSKFFGAVAVGTASAGLVNNAIPSRDAEANDLRSIR
jgi:hypothetical protein